MASKWRSTARQSDPPPPSAFKTVSALSADANSIYSWLLCWTEFVCFEDVCVETEGHFVWVWGWECHNSDEFIQFGSSSFSGGLVLWWFQVRKSASWTSLCSDVTLIDATVPSFFFLFPFLMDDIVFLWFITILNRKLNFHMKLWLKSKGWRASVV